MKRNPNSNYYRRTFLRGVMVVVAMGIFYLNVSAQTTINFDTSGNWIQDGATALNSYANHAYSESGVTIQGTNVLRNITTAQDGFPGALGTYSMRVGNTAVSKVVITVSTGGVSTFSIKVRRWDGTPIPNYTVKYSVNAGADWTNLTNIDGALLTTSDWFTYNGTINSGVDNIQIEIANTGTTERIMIDDFTWTDYSSPCPVSITSFSLSTGPIGTLVTITGSGFTGTTAVEFNGESATFTAEDDNTITATVPAGTTTGTISVTTATCTGTSGSAYTVIGQSGTCTGSSAATDLIFSEYIEGSSNNKAVEIFNGTGGDVDLSNYTIKQSNNGAGWGEISTGPDTRYVLPLSGTLASGDVYVIANSAANASILAAADIDFAFNGTANGCSGCNVPSFNGDDGLGLFNTGVLIDQIGVESPDPGTGWNVAGVTTATADHTLVRKSDVISPTTNWATSAGTDATDSQWAVSAVDYSSNLGSHTFSSGGSPIVITTQPISVSQCEGYNATFTVEATGATTYQWYENTGAAWVPIAGEESLTLEIAVAAGMDGYQYYCLLTEGTCNVASNAVQLTISGSCCLAPADEPTMLVFSNVTANSLDVDWTAPASGCDGYVVKIRRTDGSFVDLVDGTSLPSGSSAPWNDEDIVLTGSDRTGFTIGSLDQNAAYYFKVYPYNLCGSTYKFNNTGLSDFLTTSIQTYPTPVCAQGAVTLSLENFNETNAEYQWQVFDGSSWSDVANGGSYSGATARELVIDPVLQTMNGYIYVCQVSNSVHLCITPSVSFTLTVNALPDTPIIESATQNCGNTVLNMGTAPAGVTWYWQGTVSAGTAVVNSDPTYTVLSGAEGTYYLRALSTDGCWSTNSDSRIVTVKQVPVATLTLTAGCGSGSALIESDINAEQTFQLLDNVGNPLVPPRSATVTGLNHTFNGIVSGNYTATVTYNGCTSSLTAIGTLTNTIISGEPTASDETICGAGTATLTAVLGTNADRIEWSLDGITVAETDINPGPYQYNVTLLDGETIPVYVRSNNAGNCPSGWEIVNAISTLTVTAPVFNGGLPVVHCQGAGTDTFTATTVRGTIVYSLDVTVGSPITPPTINSATGVVTYNDDFVGTITITATVNGCNGPLTDTHEVTMVKHGTTGIIAL